MKDSANLPVTRRQLLSGAVAAAALGASQAARAASTRTAMPDPIVKVADGRIRGVTSDSVHVFKGIPYAASTAGANRFLPPQPVTAWRGVRDALAYGPRCPQLDGGPLMDEELKYIDLGPMSEDCLFLNIWSPTLDRHAHLPVMLWLHGGGYGAGSGSSTRYDGSNLARKHGVVVVTVNTRLNVFGYLSLAQIGGPQFAHSGNAGLLDVIQALRWIHANVGAFGGAADNVTLWGQSGGASKIATLTAMPDAQGLYHRVILESGSALSQASAASAAQTTQRLLDHLKLGASDAVEKLQALPAQMLLAALRDIKPPLQLRPVVDGETLPTNPYTPSAPALSAKVPMLIGSTLTETTFFNDTPLESLDDMGLRNAVQRLIHGDLESADRLIEVFRQGNPHADDTFLYQLISSNLIFERDVRTTAQRKAALGSGAVYLYHFEKTTRVRDGKLKSPHTLEIAYAFDNLALSRPVTGEGPELQSLADKVSSAWVAFARTGQPQAVGLPAWPPYTAPRRAVMVLNDECVVQFNPHAAEYAAIDAVPRPA